MSLKMLNSLLILEEKTKILHGLLGPPNSERGDCHAACIPLFYFTKASPPIIRCSIPRTATSYR